MTNKEKVLLELKNKSIDIDGTERIGVTADEVARNIGIKRNVASQYLNELYRESKAIKVNTRPVYFIHKEIYEEKKQNFKLANKFIGESNNLNINDSKNAFDNLVGYNGSLRSVVDQCKAAVKYPPNGLPILLVGDSGVGKSYIAQLVYNYAKEEKVIESDSKFIVFNCAEYADNPELLSSALFGVCKGAYTGANSDRKGLIEEADGGYLFLDEIHRLSFEGQEKLFVFLDKGVFRRIGESGEWRHAKVRLIFATTEKPEKFFLKTFLRRIPIITNIPNFNDRPTIEKLQLIKNIYRKEAITINKDIVLEQSVIDVLINSTWSGNIGKLINTIKITCANAFLQRKSVKDEKININISHIPKEVISNFNLNLSLESSPILISMNVENESKVKSQYKIINDLNEDIINNIKNLKKKKIKEEEFLEKVKYIRNIVDKNFQESEPCYYNENTIEVIRKIVTNNLNILKNQYGIKVSNNTIEIIIRAICYLSTDAKIDNEVKEILSYLRHKYKKSYKLSEGILNGIEANMNLKLNPMLLAYITLNLILINRELEEGFINAIIIAHGKYTASSIASVANSMIGTYIYDYIDMPIDVSTEDIVKELRKYIKNLDPEKGLILLVDMGSLQEIYLGIKDEFNGDIAIINNLSSLLSLDVGIKIINKEPIKEIIKEAVKNNVSKYNYIPATTKKKDAIITTCSTGVGTAEKIKNLLEKCLNDRDITILAYDYDKLKLGGENEYIFNEYKVKLIIGLNNPNIENIPYLSLEDMIMGSEKTKILNNILDDKAMEEINDTLLKEFTLKNVINNLIILNPDKILSQVQDAINNLEFNLKLKFHNSLKLGLYIHVSCMIERLVVKKPLLEYKKIQEFEYCNGQFIKYTKNAFSVIEKFYNVRIPTSEIAYIYDTLARELEI